MKPAQAPAQPPYFARFRCIGCGATYALSDVIYRCSSCNELLEVAHDPGPLKERDGASWRALFDARLVDQSRAGGSGVWAKHEWVMPNLRRSEIVSLGEGGSPLEPVSRLAHTLHGGQLWVKQCGLSPTGSFKDLGMTVLVSMVHQLRTDGARIRGVACASTGDTSAALAAYCARAGLPSLVILPRGKISPAQLIQPIAHGAHVLEIDSDFDGCMAIVQRLAVEEGVYLANSMNSLRLEGQKTVGIEIVQQLGWHLPDWIIIPGGNLGNVSALAAGLDLLFELGVVSGRRPRIVVAQAERANPLYRAYKNNWQHEAVKAEPTLASAIQIGNPVSWKKAVAALQRYEGIVEQASENELADAAADADRLGVFACPHTAVALAALGKLARQKIVTKNDDVVVISTANGLKFTDFKVRYHADELAGVLALHKNPPVSLPNDYDAVRRTLEKRLTVH